ncbi:MAG: fumarate hydratase [Clostridiales bacterium]|nr:fumarate hydratase [Clostridiales bacterium]
MKEIKAAQVADMVEFLCLKANTVLPDELCGMLKRCAEAETNETAAMAMKDIIANYELAAGEGLPICQDTGMTVVFADIGQDVHITGGLFEEAVNEGVARGYKNGCLRKSVVKDPLRRINTENNTPAILHIRLVPGNKLRITVAPKGFGSENMSAMKMFLPSDTADDIVGFLVETVKKAGARPCPPVILGVGLGGTIEQAALIAKRALLRPVGHRNTDPFYADMEDLALKKINDLGIGVQGFGGKCTALAVNIEAVPTHIAGLPCMVNMSCHVTRHAQGSLG